MIVALSFFVSAACAVDRRPLVRTPEYVQAIDAVGKAAKNAPRGSGEVRAGWSRVEISAPAGVPLAGYGEREGAPSEGVLDPIYVRAFVVETPGARAILFTADLLLTSPAVVEAVASELREERDVEPESLFFTASHSHSAAGGYVSGILWELVFGPYDSGAFDAVVKAHVEAAKLALDRLAPAKIGYADTRVPDLIQNRVEKGGPTDDRLLAIHFERLSDQKSAVFWSFSCHAVVLPASNRKLSADYPGMIASELEGKTHEVVGYAAGGVGSSNPRHERPDPSWLLEPLARALRSTIGDAEKSSRTAVELAHAQATVDLPSPRYRVGRETGLAAPLVQALINSEHAPFGAIAIGDLVLLHLPVEISGELTRAARSRAHRRGITLGVFPFNGSYAGYVVPHRVYDLEDARGEEMLPYETQTLAFFGKWSGDFMMNVGLRLAAGVRSAAESVRLSAP
jgi:hypothetical protein